MVRTVNKNIIIDALTGEELVDTNEFIVSEEEIRNRLLNQLMEQYTQKVNAGFTSNATGESILFGYNEKNQLDYSKYANLFALDSQKTHVVIGTDTHGVVPLTREQFINFMKDAEAHEVGLYVKRKALEEQIKISTAEELQAMVIDL